MRSIKYILLLLFSFFLRLEAQNLSSLNLAQDRYWLKLLHFQNGKSTINNQDFFLSSKGKEDAQVELIQTITQFKNTPNLVCKYPARYKWLSSKINLTIEKQNCEELETFLKPNFHIISIVFTSQRYDSPASVFGHTLMKIETNTIPYAINYSAKIPENTNSFIYAYKGLNGHYKSSYKFIPFSVKDYEYRSGEFRDLLSFTSNLNKDEINNLMLHFYEIKDIEEDYYFLSHNCSSELIKLIDMAKYNSNLVKDLDILVIPIDIVYLLEKNDYITDISNQNSKLKQFYHTINKLSKKEKEILFKIVNHNYFVNNLAKEKGLTEHSKELIIQAGITYFEIKSTKESLEQKSIYPFLKLIQLSLKSNNKLKIDTITKLDKNPISNKFHKLYAGINNRNEKFLGYRYLYRNRFDLVDDIQKNGTVELFDISVKEKGKNFSLDYLTLVNLEAMPISNIFFQESINKIKIGFKRIFEDDNLYGYFDYGLGYRYQFNKYFTYQGYLKTGAYFHKEDIYLASAEFSLEYYYNHKIMSELKLEMNYYTNGFKRDTLYFNNSIKLFSDITFSMNFIHIREKESYCEVKLFLNLFF